MRRSYVTYVLGVTLLVAVAGLAMRNVAFESGMTPEVPSFDYELLISGSDGDYKLPREACFPGTASTQKARGYAYYNPTAPDLPITQGGKRPGNHFELICLGRPTGNLLVMIWLFLVLLPIGMAVGARLIRNQE